MRKKKVIYALIASVMLSMAVVESTVISGKHNINIYQVFNNEFLSESIPQVLFQLRKFRAMQLLLNMEIFI